MRCDEALDVGVDQGMQLLLVEEQDLTRKALRAQTTIAASPTQFCSSIEKWSPRNTAAAAGERLSEGTSPPDFSRSYSAVV